jgi:hypothetical protein
MYFRIERGLTSRFLAAWLRVSFGSRRKSDRTWSTFARVDWLRLERLRATRVRATLEIRNRDLSWSGEPLPGRPWPVRFLAINHLLDLVSSPTKPSLRVESRGSGLTNASSAMTGISLRRPTFRLASWRRETRVATVRGDSLNLRAASPMPTARTVSSRCIASASPFAPLQIDAGVSLNSCVI